MENKKHKLIIVGSGPAGLTAAIYAARANFAPILLAGEQWGGQLMKTTEIENFPGFVDGILGADLMVNMLKQAEKFGAIIKYENATFVDFEKDIKEVRTANGTYFSEAVILATGSTPRKLEIEGEEKFYGRGVSTCATCDGAFYKNKAVAVVGGGDSAMEEANFLTKFASTVYLLHRKDSFRASVIMQERVKKNPKIKIIYNTEVKKVLGESKVEKLEIWNNSLNLQSELEVDGIFLAIGNIPVTGYLENKLALNDSGYVVVENNTENRTNISGIYVAGEISDFEYKQAITSAGSGCKAALEAIKYLDSRN